MCNCYQAGDGRWFWLLGVEADRLWPKLCTALGRHDLRDDERFATARGRRHAARELVETLDEIFAGSTRDELTEAFDRADVWWAPVNTPAEVFADPQAIAAGAFVDVPAGEAGPAHRAVATPVTFHGSTTPPIAPAPGLGQHTDEVLRSAGFDDDELARRVVLPWPRSSSDQSNAGGRLSRKGGDALGEVGLGHHLGQPAARLVHGLAHAAVQVERHLALGRGQRAARHRGHEPGGIGVGVIEQRVAGRPPR